MAKLYFRSRYGKMRQLPDGLCDVFGPMDQNSCGKSSDRVSQMENDMAFAFFLGSFVLNTKSKLRNSGPGIKHVK